MKVKGIELMQMIADGKLKEGTRIKNIKEDACFEYEDGDFFNKEHCLYLNRYFEYSLKGLVTDTFEILEDITEEIEELNYYAILSTSYNVFQKNVDEVVKKHTQKINELVKEINQIKKDKPIDTSKETHCMTD